MIRWLLILSLIVLPTLSGADEPMDTEILRFLVIPSPDCGLSWTYQDNYFDPLKANPELALEDITAALRKDRGSDPLYTARLKLDAATVYAELDSPVIAQRYNQEALDMLERLYRRNPSAECAFSIGQAKERLNQDKEANAWYEQAYEHDPNYYPAVFEMVSEVSFKDQEKATLWARRAKRLSDKLLGSEADASIRAEVAYEFAGVRSSIMARSQVVGWFDMIWELAGSESDESESTKQALASMKSMFGSLCSEENVSLLKTAADLDPTNTQHQVAYVGARLGQIFFGVFDIIAEKGEDIPDAEARQYFKQWFVDNRTTIQALRDRLEALPLTERLRCPVVHYYLAYADVLLDEYTIAYTEICEFIRLKPDNDSAQSLLCTIIDQMPGSNSNLGDILMTYTERKCELYPTMADCYRYGYLKWLTGDLVGSYQAFAHSALFAIEDFRPRLACAVVMLQNGQTEDALSFVQTLELYEPDLSGQEEACYFILKSVIATRNGDLDIAKYWAEKAANQDDPTPESQALLGYLNSR